MSGVICAFSLSEASRHMNNFFFILLAELFLKMVSYNFISGETGPNKEYLVVHLDGRSVESPGESVDEQLLSGIKLWILMICRSICRTFLGSDCVGL